MHGFFDFRTSLYFSLVSYSTVGYGDIVLPEGFRLIGAVEGLLGTIMVGWTVAILVRVLKSIR
ncbi:ion channel [Dongshaea marina]|uniref:ion channel n=1 Tax=Dongshaea marina TaxID=2047966 RepID=UPI003898DBFB